MLSWYQMRPRINLQFIKFIIYYWQMFNNKAVELFYIQVGFPEQSSIKYR